ncbi:unnamed protein product [Effrenium voratum]|nr:unnamed protein product [Effrenium voratum]
MKIFIRSARQEPGAISMHSDGGVAKTDMAIREGEVNRWLAWCSDEQTGMLQQRPTRGASSMSKIAAPAGLCQSSVFSNWRSASMDTAVTS